MIFFSAQEDPSTSTSYLTELIAASRTA